ncbi:hypothetical protein AWW68_17840 [Roseivirga spongicola]|uniref:DUF885 domain-containing protein n=1 Tax=Roseivirga spongicola TaxID=333140 RepID=A0A150WZG9_9BACT|nr:DUF885 family protein [Roseivirga spongicola]KYG71879.1 hypothetical protein AWW68_17840 [Roseivirga spongicola]
MQNIKLTLAILVMVISGCQSNNSQPAETKTKASYQDLVQLFKDWRAFETPPLLKGTPDYTKVTFDERWPEFKMLQTQLHSMDTTGWSIPEQVDYHIVWAEMNGYDFNHRVLKPWQRDPAFYKVIWMHRSDVPAHEGPTNHGTVEVWTYNFPLIADKKDEFLQGIKTIPTFNEQAKENLTGNARDLWIAGIRDIKTQSQDLESLKSLAGVAEDNSLMDAIDQAISSTNELAEWLENESTSKTGPSGIGKENYTWYLQNVHLVPLTWEDEVMILKRELARAWSALKLEEHRNRNLPELTAAGSPEEYDAMADRSAKSLLKFLDEQEIVTVKDYFEPALRAHLGEFIPNFFTIGEHYDARPLYSHFYHWFELARMDNEPHPSEIRREPLLYNIFDSRNEGTATAVEEMFMDAGLYEDDPRVREIVLIMIAQRAARGLGSLYAHANEMTMEEAGGIHSEFTPRGWMKTEKELLIFEQHLYLRQPGYGTSYITGKYLLEAAMADYARLNEDNFKLKDFFDQLNSIGSIPIALGHWQMTGVNDQVLSITTKED